MSDDLRDRLVDVLSDIYAIEQQALAQLRSAPDIVDVEPLARAFREHLQQTEGHAERIEGRLEAHGASPSRIKDAVMALGGKGSLLFARSQPDTPGKLAAHAFSFEAFEWACHDMLARLAERAGDEATAGVAREIRDQELAMQERIHRHLVDAADASLGDPDEDDLDRHMRHYLADAHALEEQAIALLDRCQDDADDGELAAICGEYGEQSRRHQQPSRRAWRPGTQAPRS